MKRFVRRARRAVRSERLRRAVNGSISILLVIVLVPVISVAGLFVDASRYQLAKSEVAAAGDLTLNTALSDYDTVLKDVYGLFAVSQSDEDLQENLEEYFTQMLVDSGVAEDESSVLSNVLLQDIVDAASGVESTSNLLSMVSDTEENAFSASGVEGSQLSEPDVLKNQIVEFCKYRTPVKTMLSFIDGIEAIKNTTKQSQITTDAAEVDEAVQDLNDACEKLAEAVNDYQECVDGNTDLLDLSSIDSLNGTSYKTVLQDTILPAAVDMYSLSELLADSYMSVRQGSKYTTGWAMTYRPASSSITDFTTLTKKDGSNSVTSFKVNGSYTKTGLTKANWTADDLKAELEENIKQLKKGTLSTTVSLFSLTSTKKTVESKVGLIEDYEEALGNAFRLLAVYDCYLNALKAEEDSDELVEAAEDEYGSDVDTYMEQARSLIEAMSSQINAYNSWISSAESTLDSLVSDYSAKLDVYEELEDYIDTCAKKIKKVKDEIENVEDANGDLASSLSNYGSDDSFKTQMQEKYESYEDLINSEDYQELKSKIDSLDDYIGECVTYLKSIKLFGKRLDKYSDLSDITGKSDFKSSVDSGTSKTTAALGKSIVSSYYSSDTKPSSQDLSISGYNFYLYLVNTFGEDSDEDDDEAQSTKDSLTSNAETSGKAATTATDITNESISSLISSSTSGTSASISDLNTNDNSGYSDMLTSMTTTVSAIVDSISDGDLLTDGRDYLYVVDYVMSMFTYYTEEAEYKVENGESGDVIIESMTGTEKNSSNNRLYRSEVEYLIYGNDSTADNVSSAKSQIFAIRFVCNTVYAMTNNEINTITLTPALSIQAASGGVIPYQLPQMVMKIALALVQSSVDLSDMMDGESVPLMHSEDTWKASGSGVIKTVAEAAIEKGSEKLTGALNALIDQGTSAVETKVDDVISDVESVAEDQARQAVESVFNAFSESLEGSASRLSANIDYVGDNTQALAEEMIDDALEAAQAVIDKESSGTIHDALQSVYDSVLKSEASSLKSTIASKIEEIKAGASVNSVVQTLQETINSKIDSKIEDATDTVKSKVNSLIDELSSSIKSQLGETIDSAASELNEAVSEQIDDWFSDTFGSYTSTSSSVSAGVTSCLKFSYSDYLCMFLYIGLIGNSDDILTRTASLIELNINSGVTSAEGDTHALAESGSFSMSEAYTYYEINASFGLETMFLSYPLVTSNMGVESVSAFRIRYHGAQGY